MSSTEKEGFSKLLSLYSALYEYCDEVADSYRRSDKGYYGLSSWSKQEVAKRDRMRDKINSHRKVRGLNDEDDQKASQLAAEMRDKSNKKQGTANEDGRP